MVLTYSMVLNRLDQLNERERQVRDFYKPLPGLPRETPWPQRHRFADKLEAGDVVKTMGKGNENWDGDLLGVEDGDDGVGEAEDQHASSHTSRPATVGPHSSTSRRGSGEPDGFNSMPSFANSWQNRPNTAAALGPSRDSRKMVNYAVKKEKQLRKAVDEELNQRREKMRQQLQKEVGLIGDDGEEEEGIPVRVEPLFRPPGRVMQMQRKPTVHKTGTAPSKELAVYETAGMQWNGGPTFHAAGEEALREKLSHEYGDEMKDVEDHVEREEERRAQAALFSTPSRRSHLDDDEMSEQWQEEEDGGGLDGDYSTWRYRKTLAGDHEDPEQRDFYFAQIRVGAAEKGDGAADAGSANRRFIVKVIDETLRSRPEFTYPSALSVDGSGLLLFPRNDPFSAHSKTTVMSLADDLPWVSDPRQLLGHVLRVQVFGRTAQLTRGALVCERQLHFRPPLDAYHPPASAPVNQLNSSGGSSLFPPPPRPAARPDTAPAHGASPVAQQRSGLRERSGAASPGGAGKGGGRKEAVDKWNQWVAEGGAAGGGQGEGAAEAEGAGAGAEGAGVAEESSGEGLSPLARKKRQLARMRQQMRASLQQTQNKMMAGSVASTDARSASAQAGGPGAPGGVAPMVVSRAGLASAGPLRRQPSGSGSGSSPGRPASQQASREG